MITHQDIDERLLRMVRLCVDKIDRDPSLLAKIESAATRIADPRIRSEWAVILHEPWPRLRSRLLEDSESGASLRQNAPFGGLLDNRERLTFFRR